MRSLIGYRLLTAALAVVMLVGVTASAAYGDAPVRRFAGTLAGGTDWIADVPANWNGVLVLYGHGYRPPGPGPNRPSHAPDPHTADLLLSTGYALAGSSYRTAGWVLDTAAEDQLATLREVVARIGRPDRTIALGTSMGGLVTAQLAERGGEFIDGAVPTCGVLAGGLGQFDSQLDGVHALTRLLLPGQRLAMTGFATEEAANRTAARLVEALDAAQSTARGRARIALAAALFHAPTWQGEGPPPDATDRAGQQAAQYRWLRTALPFLFRARAEIERRAGGNPSTNDGVDYRERVRQARTWAQVRELYRAAGLDLDQDLTRIDDANRVVADPRAREWLRRTSSVQGRPEMPVLAVHTVADGVVPSQFEDAFADRVRDAGRAELLRTAFVARAGHCDFTPAEIVAAVTTVNTRIRTGRWGDLAAAESLDAVADTFGSGNYVPYRPGEFLGDKGR